MIKFNLIKKENPQETYNDIIYLTRDDLCDAEKNKNAYEIELWDFKISSLSHKQCLNANLIAFTENYSIFILKNRYGNDSEVYLKNIELKREDLLPEFHNIPMSNMELYHFNPSIINDNIISYADNITYKDEFNGRYELIRLKYTR